MSNTIAINVSFRGNAHVVTLTTESTLAGLHDELERITSVPPSMQKLIFKGKKAHQSEDVTLPDAGIKDGMKIQLLGSTPAEIGGMQKVEEENRKREEILKAREAKARPKVRSTGSAVTNPYVFHRVVSLSHLPSPHLALSLLNKLAADPAILHVMSLHQFHIGILTELAPHEHPNLLGLNQNKGEVIKLRVRTDAYDGMRNYREIRRVLCHELTHCVWGDHDNNFKELNSLLNRQVAEYEASVKAGTHSLSPYSGSAYEPSLEADAFATSHVLGGSSSSVSDDTPEARRQRVLQATIDRLAREEKEIEDMCGSIGNRNSTTSGNN